MRCPFCSAQDTKVIDSRLAGDGDQIRRRRECLACHERFTTYETAELSMPKVVKTNGSRVVFEEARLRSGMTKALEKRPVPSDELEKAINGIRHRLISSGEREIASRTLGDWVMEALRDLDQVAFVRFASVYRDFKDVNEFKEEIDRLSKEPTPEQKRTTPDLFNDD